MFIVSPFFGAWESMLRDCGIFTGITYISEKKYF